ncbi:RNA polymerase sigma factor [Portibacter marinus]|uniref:RNA polymerase sigma factor n=1 Tax=Portibacter marinus TaxID=2898660 RepID=UPI001F223E3C|nr:RNA polymerase sigma factor [Portibacter marinus]
MSEDFYLKYIKPYELIIYKITRAYTNSDDDFKDYYQEVCLQIWRSRKSFQGNSQYSTWIYRLTLNICLTLKRKEKQRKESSLENSSISIYEIESENYSSEMDNQLAHLYQGIKQLSEIDRAIILLHLEKKNYQEIAEIIGLKANNIGVKINRIKKKLKSIINGS